MPLKRRLKSTKPDGKRRTRASYVTAAQKEVNRYIRLRDRNKPCISCGTWNAAWNAGHYFSTGSSPHLRFNLLNIHKQCVVCNMHLSGNLIRYRQNLVKKIGEDRVLVLESTLYRKQYTTDDLIRIRKIFKKRADWYAKRF